MRMRTIFCPKGDFDRLEEFLSYLESLISKSKGGYDASFYLFPEDITSLYERLGRMGLTVHEGIGKMYPKTHEEMLFFIKRVQGILGPRDFVIFSLYSSVGSLVMNSGFFVGKKQWFFEYKRVLSESDMDVVGVDAGELWLLQAKLMAKSPRCVKAGDLCIKGLHLLVCADIKFLPKMRLSSKFLCFVPAYDLGELQLHQIIQQVSGLGSLFINDAFNGRAWAFSFKGKDKGVEKLTFEGKPISFEFEG